MRRFGRPGGYDDRLLEHRAGAESQNVQPRQLWNMVQNPLILDPVESLLGPDLLCCDHGTFDLETEPEGELHPAALKRYAGILRASKRIVSTQQRTAR